jgi:phosphopantothenoylcysteine decarboxylase/phosphopantothenate--cysteine ligase
VSRRVLILSGPTHEYLDPVRFIGNASSGKTGKALADEALNRGMEVEFITGPVFEANLPGRDRSPSGPGGAFGERALPDLKIQRIISAEEMLAAAQAKFDEADIIIFAAAVADYRPAQRQTQKIEKGGGNLMLELEPVPDIAATLCADKREDQIAIGFALQTHDGETKAKEKLISKNLDGIILNTPATLGAEDGLFTWLDAEHVETWGSLDKAACAKRIFSQVDRHL